jgi:hypothetical protein
MFSKTNRRVLTTLAGLATLTITSLASAAVSSDFNKSGSVGLEDLQAFFAAYYSGDKSADANGDGRLTYQDIFTFSQQWAQAYSKGSTKGSPRTIDKTVRPSNDSTLR